MKQKACEAISSVLGDWLHRLFVSSQGTRPSNCIMKQRRLAVLIITYSWVDVNCTKCAMMRH